MSYTVIPYSITNLVTSFLLRSKSTELDIQKKLHLPYFESYFKDVNAATYLIETPYVDKD